MALYTATADFSTVITVDSENTNLVCAKGSDYELTDNQFEAVERDLPGALKPAKKTAAKKAKPADDPAPTDPAPTEAG